MLANEGTWLAGGSPGQPSGRGAPKAQGSQPGLMRMVSRLTTDA